MEHTRTNDFPVRLDNPRAWRTYTGGRMLDQLHGNPDGVDTQFPEEWIMSLVAARNAGREDILDEGMSHLYGEEITLQTLLAEDPVYYLGEAAPDGKVSLGVLTKLIDSAERLTLQAHPTRDKALELFGSPYGKTECWHILGGREIDGEKPCVYLGFKPGITRERWKQVFDEQDIEAMLDCVQRFEVHPGDTVLVCGGMPHAIGAGCFLAEIQEPTDYTIRVERTTPNGLHVDDFMCHQGLGFDRMFDVFGYEDMSREEIHDRYFIQPCEILHTAGGSVQTLVGYQNTELFRLDEIQVTDTLTVEIPEQASGLYVLEGSGCMRANGREEQMEQTAQYFVPVGTRQITFTAVTGKPLKILHFFGPCK